METEQPLALLKNMMRTYEGPQNNVTAMSLQGEDVQFLSSGTKDAGIAAEDLIFEIGSITKVFTAILLCLLVEEGKIDPNAPLRTLSDDLAPVPHWITPNSLISHTSGLPRIHVPLWSALLRPLPKDPYASFSRADLLAWMQNWAKTAKQPKPRHLYSNIGIGLLGEALSMLEGKPFTALLTERVITPLGLKDTTAVLTQAQLGRFAPPHNNKGQPVPAWTFQSMAAAGCLRATARDIARLSQRVIKAHHAAETPLDRAIRNSAAPIVGFGPKGQIEPAAQCSGWFLMTLDTNAPGFLHHDGGTAGSTAALYICPEKAAACAILSNTGLAASLWGSAKLSWSNQLRQAHNYFAAC